MKLCDYNPLHLSPSTINSFITNRAGFRASKVLRRPFIQTPSMSRGKAVEEIVNRWIEDRGVPFINEEHIGICALEFYDKENAAYMEAFPNFKDPKGIRDSVSRLAVKALEVYKDKCISSKPMTQTKVYTKLEGVERQILGCLDYFWHGQKVEDCKVLQKNMSKLSIDYCISGALYRQATGCPVIFSSFVPLKKETSHKEHKLTDEQFKFGISYATAAAKCIEAILVCEDPNEMFRLMSFPNIATIWDRDDQQKVADEWGFQLMPEDDNE